VTFIRDFDSVIIVGRTKTLRVS